MQEENKEDVRERNLKQNKTPDPNSWRKNLLEWLGILTVGAVLLFFLAPESWWQFGVAPERERKPGAEFSLRTLSGETWNLAARRGRVVIINYWATWCGPCRLETPGLVNIFNEYRTRGVEMVGVTMDENLADVPPFVEKYRITYDILLPGSDPNLGTDAIALPTTFLYDKNGRIAKKYTGLVLESTLKSDIEELLKEK